MFDYSNDDEELCNDYEHQEVESIIKDMYPNENIILYTDPHCDNSNKLFESEISNPIEIYFKDKINYKLLNDIMDLSLDLCDYGYRLRVNISYEKEISSHSVVCTLYFDHQGIDYFWKKDNYNIMSRTISNGISYEIVYDFVGTSYDKNSFSKYKKELSEIYSIIKNMYPNELIFAHLKL